MNRVDAGLTAFTADPRFTGAVSGVHIAPDGDPLLHSYVVHFEVGGRTAWHAHDRGQLLICTAGHGYVGTRDGRVIELTPAVAAWTDAGEDHWHGAGQSSSMTHVAVQTETPDGRGLDWREPLSADDWTAVTR